MDKDAGPVGVTGWEYKVIKIGPSTAPTSEAVLNELGSAGWDLVGFQQANGRAYPGEGTYILKRPRPMSGRRGP
jgi:hypothetical protein